MSGWSKGSPQDNWKDNELDAKSWKDHDQQIQHLHSQVVDLIAKEVTTSTATNTWAVATLEVGEISRNGTVPIVTTLSTIITTMMIVVMVAITIYITIFVIMIAWWNTGSRKDSCKDMKVMRKPKLWNSIRKNVEPEVDYYRSKNRLDSFWCIETNHDAVGLMIDHYTVDDWSLYCWYDIRRM